MQGGTLLIARLAVLFTRTHGPSMTKTRDRQVSRRPGSDTARTDVAALNGPSVHTMT